MKVFLELSSSAKNSDDAMYKIIRYVAEKFDIDWFQIMKVNTKEDLITISYEWCSDPKFQNNAGKEDIMLILTLSISKNSLKRSVE